MRSWRPSARRRVPDSVRERARRAGLTPGERVLASAEAEDGTWLLGTRDRLVLVAQDAVTLLPWEQLHRADWDQEASALHVEPVQDWGRAVVRRSFVLDDPEALLTLVRERVTASVVVHQRIELGRRQGLSVVGRRAPAGAGEIAWAYELDRGVDPADPAVQIVAEAALRDAKDSLGLR